MKNKLIVLSFLLLGSITVLNFIYNTQSYNQLQDIKATKDKPTQIVYVQAKDGKTPIKGIDYFDGTNGINAMSYSITNTVVKDVPLLGIKGDDGFNGKDGADGKNGENGSDGKDAPIQEIRVNPETGDLESKNTNQRFWSTLIPCSQLQVGCPE